AGGKRTVIDGPFAETKELIGGYAIVQAKSKEEAIALANRVVDVHIDAGVTEVEMEIRPLYDAADFEAPARLRQI
ncbi:MAG: YciI family protein, partial [Gammaproteobacteria bacterium]